MALFKTKDRCYSSSRFPDDPVFFCARKSRISSARTERVKKVWPVFPAIFPHYHKDYLYRLANLSDLEPIISLVDSLLAGKDFFCPHGQHLGYFKYKTILLCFDSTRLIGWAVRQKNGSLIHLLVEPDYRGQGVGGHLLKVLEPLFVRSKSDQSTGDPYAFYEKHGYEKTSPDRIGKKHNIDLLSKRPSV